MADWYSSKPGPITPVALPGHNVAIWTGVVWVAYKVVFMEPFPRSNPLVFDSGAVGAGLTANALQLILLEMSDSPSEMAQLRFFPLDDIRVRLTRGQSGTRFKSQSITTLVDKFTKMDDPCGHTTEFVVLTTDEPFIQVANPTGYALAISRVAFFGFRFIMDDLKVKHERADQIEARVSPITFVAAGGI